MQFLEVSVRYDQLVRVVSSRRSELTDTLSNFFPGERNALSHPFDETIHSFPMLDQRFRSLKTSASHCIGCIAAFDLSREALREPVGKRAKRPRFRIGSGLELIKPFD
jgi:hypothetical protein